MGEIGSMPGFSHQQEFCTAANHENYNQQVPHHPENYPPYPSPDQYQMPEVYQPSPPGMSNEWDAVPNAYREQNAPCALEIIEEPISKIRFRYQSEKGSHGSMSGRNSSNTQKCWPTVKLLNYNLNVNDLTGIKIRASLFTEDRFKPHVHRLLGKSCNPETGDCVLPLQQDLTCSFPNLGVLFTEKKKVPEVLLNRRKSEYGDNLTEDLCKQLTEQAKQEAKVMKMNTIRIRFEAININDELISHPVYSEPVHNLKSPDSGELKITRLSRCCSSCDGDVEVFLLCEKVNKKDIKVKFFQLSEDGQEIWSAFGKFADSDVHHQVAIVFRTPPYRDRNIDKTVKVFVQLYRQNDGETSESLDFFFKPRDKDPDHIQMKRRRLNDQDNDFKDFGSHPDFSGHQNQFGPPGPDHGQWGDGSGNPGQSDYPMLPPQGHGFSQGNQLLSFFETFTKDLQMESSTESPSTSQDSSSSSSQLQGADPLLSASLLDNDSERCDTIGEPFTLGDMGDSIAQPFSPSNFFLKDDGADSSMIQTDSSLPCRTRLPSTVPEVGKNVKSSKVQNMPVAQGGHSDFPSYLFDGKSRGNLKPERTEETELPQKTLTEDHSEGANIQFQMAEVRYINVNPKEDLADKMKDLSMSACAPESQGIKKDGGKSRRSSKEMNPTSERRRGSKDLKSEHLPGHNKKRIDFRRKSEPSNLDFKPETHVQREVSGRQSSELRSKMVIENFVKKEMIPRFGRSLRLFTSTGKIQALLWPMAPFLASQNRDGDNAVHLAVIHQSSNKTLFEQLMPIVRSLMPYNVINHTNNMYQTPLHLAVAVQEVSIINWLLLSGADPNFQDNRGNTPIHMAVLKKDSTCLNCLLEESYYKTRTVRKPVPNSNILNYDGYSAMHLAVLMDSKKCLSVLMEADALVNVQDGTSGRTPLHLAVQMQSPLVQDLLSHPKMDVNAKDYAGNTALHLACSLKLSDMVYTLMKAGANPKAQNSDVGTDAWEDEEQEGESRPDEDIENEPKGMTPMDIAAKDQEILSILHGTMTDEVIEKINCQRFRKISEVSKANKTGNDNSGYTKSFENPRTVYRDTGEQINSHSDHPMTSKDLQNPGNDSGYAGSIYDSKEQESLISRLCQLLDPPNTGWEKLASVVFEEASMTDTLRKLEESPTLTLYKKIMDRGHNLKEVLDAAALCDVYLQLPEHLQKVLNA